VIALKFKINSAKSIDIEVSTKAAVKSIVDTAVDTST
jgi:hypothetical protein